MINPVLLINSINDSLKSSFENPPFKLIQKRHNVYVLEGTSFAINRKKNDSIEVKVLPWFKEFWLYIEIISLEKTSISISVFKGAIDDNEKHQLFRAEWDDYERDNETHPQPHWHITTDLSISESYKKLMEDNDDGFELFEMAKSEVFDIKNVHFAMNGNWQNDETHIHKLNNEQKIVKWVQGILRHIKTELE